MTHSLHRAVGVLLVSTVAVLGGCGADDVGMDPFVADGGGVDMRGADMAAVDLGPAADLGRMPDLGQRLDGALAPDARGPSPGGPSDNPNLDRIESGRFVVISNNTVTDLCGPGLGFDDCDPGAQEGVMSEWNGGAFADNYHSHGGLMAWGGGHAGYSGNEVYMFDVNTGLWSALAQPPVDTSSCTSSTSEYPDGTPRTGHTYEGLEYAPITGEFVKLLVSSDGAGVVSTGTVHLFNIFDGTWRRGMRKPTWENAGGGSDDGEGASSAYDARRGLVWGHVAWRGYETDPDKAFSSYDPVTDVWTEYPGANVGIDHAAAIDPVRDLYVLGAYRSGETLVAFDLANPSAGPVELNVTGTANAATGQMGFEYDSDNAVFAAYNAGGGEGSTISVLTPPAGDWRTEPWVCRIEP